MSSSELYRLVYISRAVDFFSPRQLSVLLEQARSKNESRSITGLLLYKDLSFIQVLEGTKSSIEKLYSSISKDPRHFRLKLLIDMEPIDERSFPQWSMGFQALDQQEYSQRAGFSDFFETELPAVLAGESKNTQTLNKLLNYFRYHS